jgi:hypothetical protein
VPSRRADGGGIAIQRALVREPCHGDAMDELLTVRSLMIEADQVASKSAA